MQAGRRSPADHRVHRPTLTAEVAGMIQTVRSSLRDHIDLVYYSLLRATVAWLVPAAVQFDERDPILGSRFDPEPFGR